MCNKIKVELTREQLYYLTKLLGTMNEVTSLDILEEALDMTGSQEEIVKLQELISNHRKEDGFSFETFSSLADQLDAIDGIR